jgi:hypothetical protein
MASAKQTSATQEYHEPLANVITRVEKELENIASLIDHNQSLIARLTWQAGGSDPAYVKAMQDADLISQKIVGIANFLRAIADAVPADFHVETQGATGNLRLAELIRKIGARGGEIDHREDSEAGDFDLF